MVKGELERFFPLHLCPINVYWSVLLPLPRINNHLLCRICIQGETIFLAGERKTLDVKEECKFCFLK